jgi:hypothetical protein
VSKLPDALFYHSIKYRNFLKQILGEARDKYLLAYDNDELIAALPSFVKKGPFGAVVNSLPFYGSNGAIISNAICSDATKIELLNYFDSMCKREEAIASTIIQNPMARDKSIYNNYDQDVIDERIGQLTPLPSGLPTEKVCDHLMNSFHVKTRNMVRKGKKYGFEIEVHNNIKNLTELHRLHETNMQAIGGLAKPWNVFQAIHDNFEYDQDYRIYTARHNETVAAALLVFFFNKKAEYFIPTINVEYRPQQPLSYLIFLAMQDAVAKGCQWWNWGGTWFSQDGVYRFKSRWGTKDFNYKYYIKFHANPTRLKQASKVDVLSSYPFFYVLPFSELSG